MIRVDERTVEFTAREWQVKDRFEDWRENTSRNVTLVSQAQQSFVVFLATLPRSMRGILTPEFVEHLTDGLVTWSARSMVAIPRPIEH